MNTWAVKWYALLWRFQFGIRSYPKRLLRVVRQLGRFFAATTYRSISAFLLAILDVILLVGDLLFLPEIYESLMDWLKWKSRPLSHAEIDVARSVFGEAIDYRLIRWDMRSWARPKYRRYAYVSFHTINSFGPLADQVLIHELVHVWQYCQLGSAYIGHAIRAHLSTAKYNYGGLAAVEELKASKAQLLHAFNIEQQADLVTDYFLIRAGRNAQWGSADARHLSAYAYFVDQIRHSKTAVRGRRRHDTKP